MQVLAVTNLPIYLPFDKAPIPFGDSIQGITVTAAAPGVITSPGYDAPAAGDAVSLSFTAGGSMPAPLVAGQQYFVVSPSTDTFSVSATKGGSAITTTTVGANLVLHLLSGQLDGVTLPFKPGNTVLVENNSGGTLVLQGAPDVNVAAPGQGYNPPGGPGTYVQIASLTAGAQQLVQLGFDWVRVSTAGTLYLIQN